MLVNCIFGGAVFTAELLAALNSFLYGRLLIGLLLGAGVFFTVRLGLVQLRLLPEALRVTAERPGSGRAVSSFGALMVSTASRVGTGNIVGVSTAICMGGSGAVFWMWVISLIGGATGFAEAVLAQLYKRRDGRGGFFGGPACYIERVCHSRVPAACFCLCLILTYGLGFNMLSSYNLQSSFSGYCFYRPDVTPAIIGAALALSCLFCLLGGEARIVKISEALVPLMALAYLAAALVTVLRNLSLLPSVLSEILRCAFDGRAIFSGFSGSCVMYGVRRGLFSNEAGVGSAPNAAASAEVSHPVKQGLVQTLSVFIDSALCTATALMCLCSGAEASPELSGMPYVQAAARHGLGAAGPAFLTSAMVLFAFTSLLGNFFYIDNCLTCLLRRRPPRRLGGCARITACALSFAGCLLPMELVWNVADALMGAMCLLNLPALLILSGEVKSALDDYARQRREGKNPVFDKWRMDDERKTIYKYGRRKSRGCDN
ncbi:MAG: alanine:cation symporter family protein [Butyricicoccus sp.]|nr:alanine:cation symporter family protein [Butyricicoccus sp.]